MNQFFEQLKNEGQKTRMSSAERSLMRARILGKPTASPYMFFHFQFTRVLAPALVVAMVLTGGGSAYAAQGALPGDMLYPIKVNINERVAEALATSPEAKVAFHTKAAQERLEEAEVLAAEGRLDAAASVVVEDNFEHHATQAEALGNELEDKEGALAELDSSLAVHGEILAELSSGSTQEDTRENSDRLARRAFERSGRREGDAGATVTLAAKAAPEAALTTAASEPVASATVSTSSGSTAATSATLAPTTSNDAVLRNNQAQGGLEERARAWLAQAQGEFVSAKTSLDEQTAAQVEATLVQIEARINEGEYRNALREAVKLSALLKAEQRLGTQILMPLLTNEGRGEVRGASTFDEVYKGEQGVESDTKDNDNRGNNSSNTKGEKKEDD